MGKEIERKFLVDQSTLPSDINGTEYSQSYISINESGVVRVRIKEKIAVLTIKSGGLGLSRDEFEYEIPLEDAKALQNLFNNEIIYKTRYNIIYKGKKWEVDQFHKKNKGLWIAEIELESEEESFDVPEWVLEEITGDENYDKLTDVTWRDWLDDYNGFIKYAIRDVEILKEIDCNGDDRIDVQDITTFVFKDDPDAIMEHQTSEYTSDSNASTNSLRFLTISFSFSLSII